MVGMWDDQFGKRMSDFERDHPASGIAVSVKIKAPSGCFHRECSPNAYAIIDRHMHQEREREAFVFEEHETGPELLAYLVLTAAGISLAGSVIDLVVTIIKARAEGIREGDRPDHPLELIVRRVRTDHSYSEEIVLRIHRTDDVDGAAIDQALTSAAERLLTPKEIFALPDKTEEGKKGRKKR